MTVTPSSGVAWLTTFTAQAQASDVDGDALTYTWKNSRGGTATGTMTSSGTTFVFTIDPGHDYVDSVVVSDGKGGSASVKVAANWRVISGTNVGTIDNRPFVINIDQVAGTFGGTPFLDGRLPNGEQCEGHQDPADRGTIDAQGRFHLRFHCKQRLGNVSLDGEFTADRRLVGVATGAGFAGTSFEFHQAPYGYVR